MSSNVPKIILSATIICLSSLSTILQTFQNVASKSVLKVSALSAAYTHYCHGAIFYFRRKREKHLRFLSTK